MAVSFFLKGLVIGFSIAAPVGPIGVLCIQRTLFHGRAAGFASGLGAATADAVYGIVAAVGLTLISSFLVEQQLWLRLIGGAFLLWLGCRSFAALPADPRAGNSPNGGGKTIHVAGAYGSTALLTLTNPATILSSLAIFAGLGIGATRTSYDLAAILVLGIFIGSAIWWLILSGITGYFREKMRAGDLVWVNRGSGVIIVAFGLAAIGSLLIAD